ncbi:MAG TPA: tRNA uridine-5-carboxymethylaminomethyl(34) synthesis GTPase MnmE [Spirochaetota bacterium]|nr:tRNA uridine-5-carboxymethylaminomethyl(34) synthesis GTPase MnmE [Spirochaetota bacterium]HPJ35318.1 tRNA uridine-5-carboxymethylaminomethyl(34) synthesis GTPase MnmE [Spirochaetota bacterium]
MHEDTICAPATAPVNSSLSIIRVSGPESYRAASCIFSSPEKIKHRIASYGSIVSGDEVIDDVILVYYKSPSSFTGEDMIEISCHGNPIIVSRIMKLLFSNGVRSALPGEFSKRAFLNGKMDLAEAEAINSLINARSDWEIKTSIEQMHGSLSRTVNNIRDDVILLKADLEAGIDFIDQDIEFVSYERGVELSAEIKLKLADFHERCIVGEKVSKGVDVILAGRPNVGKSSLLNLILNEERAIVSDIPGTTRDLIRETIQVGGVRINLTDTAGIGVAGDDIEKIGIERTKRKIADASLVLAVIDGVAGVTDEDREILASFSDKKIIYVLNKVDLITGERVTELRDETGYEFVPVSAKFGNGFRELENAISDVINSEFVDYNNSFLADTRITGILSDSVLIIERVAGLFERKELPEIIAFELNELADRLSEITGEISPDDVLGSIFSRFCIGK